MKIDNIEYEVIVIKKENMNTYIRVKDDLKIYVTTNRSASKTSVNTLLDNNYEEIKKMIEKVKKRNEKNEDFYYLGNVYDIIITNGLDILVVDNRIYVSSQEYLDKWLNNETKKLFKERMEIIESIFKESIPKPNLKIRKMKTRWGVCNRKNNNVTLNSELIKYDVKCLDYVIIHELSHFVHFDHSKNFWFLVSRYCPDYKNIRKTLKE